MKVFTEKLDRRSHKNVYISPQYLFYICVVIALHHSTAPLTRNFNQPNRTVGAGRGTCGCSNCVDVSLCVAKPKSQGYCTWS